MDIEINDIVVLKKPHPCGFNQWRVARLGADIKLECLQCGRFVMLTREQMKKSFRSKLEKK